MIKKLFFLSLIFSFIVESKNVAIDLIAFSFNRPLQLYAFLESTDKYVSGLNKIYIIYRASSVKYEQAYKEVEESFENVCFVRQGGTPKKDFKPLLLKCFYGSNSEYVVFGVDDIIVKDYFDCRDCLNLLKETGAYGFYLRLGKNVTTNYNSKPSFNHQPVLQEIYKNVYTFKFSEGFCDWAYPNTVDMTIYKKSSVDNFLNKVYYSSPNTLEGAWANKVDLSGFGLCFSQSKILNIPLNIVQQDWANPHNNSLTVNNLLDKWCNGLKIDIESFFKFNNNSPHIKVVPIFVKR